MIHQAPRPRQARLVIDALAANFGGTAYAGVQIAEALARHEAVAEVTVIARPDSIVAAGVGSVAGLRLVEVPGPRRAELVHRAVWEATRLPRLLRATRAEGLFVLSGMLPRTTSLPCPVVGLQANPTVYGTRAPGAVLRRIAVDATSRKAVATYVPSEHVRSLAASLARAKVVPLGVDGERFRPADVPGTELLCVADFYPHKRHDVLLRAYERLGPDRPALRLIGNPDVSPVTFEAVRTAADRIAGVKVEGKVPFSELLAAYRSARMLLIASEQESFCMPVAEALVAGVPVIANDLPSLRETGGPGARFVGGGDVAQWAREIDVLLTNDDAWRRQRADGLAHARRFSWDTYAATLVDDLLVGRP